MLLYAIYYAYACLLLVSCITLAELLCVSVGNVGLYA